MKLLQKMISADVRACIVQKKNRWLYVILFYFTLFYKYIPCDMQFKKGMNFSFNFGWYSIKLDIARLRTGGRVFNRQNL